jgi:RimJ/RimL family protein N-acetyltransferase
LNNRTHWGFLVCQRETGSLAGVINISNAIRGPFQSAFLGYYVFTGFERQGYMREGLKIQGRWRDHQRWARVAG